MVTAKGKGKLTTYWLQMGNSTKAHSNSGVTVSSSDSGEDIGNVANVAAPEKAKAAVSKHARLVDWNVEILGKLLKEIVARRAKAKRKTSNENSVQLEAESLALRRRGTTVLEEVQEIIKLPKFDANTAKTDADIESIQLDKAVVSQLQKYVQMVAKMYQDNPFHNFEHARYVWKALCEFILLMLSMWLD